MSSLFPLSNNGIYFKTHNSEDLRDHQRGLESLRGDERTPPPPLGKNHPLNTISQHSMLQTVGAKERLLER